MSRRLVSSQSEIRQSVSNFDAGLLASSSNMRLGRKLMRQTSFWVFDAQSQNFGPSKWAGFANMTFADYQASLNGTLDGERFDGHTTRVNIERLVTVYSPNASLDAALQAWATARLGPLVFDGISTTKWVFVTLP